MKAMQRRSDNILFSEIKYPPSRHFPVCKALAASLPPKAMREQTLVSHTALRMTAVFHPRKLSRPHIAGRTALIKTGLSPMAFGAGSDGNTICCLKTKCKAFRFHARCTSLGKGQGQNPGAPPAARYLPFAARDIQLGGTIEHPSTDADGNALDL